MSILLAARRGRAVRHRHLPRAAAQAEPDHHRPRAAQPRRQRAADRRRGAGGRPPLIGSGDAADFSDPLPQALALTAIVITFAVTAFLLALAYRSWLLTARRRGAGRRRRPIVAGGGDVDKEVSDDGRRPRRTIERRGRLADATAARWTRDAARRPADRAAPARRGAVDHRRPVATGAARRSRSSILTDDHGVVVGAARQVDRDGPVVLAGRRLARADRASRWSPTGSRRSCSSSARSMLLAVLVYAIGQPGAERNHVGFQSVYLVLAAGVAAVVPHRRPVQPVRRVRDDAHRELRADDARRPAATRCAPA